VLFGGAPRSHTNHKPLTHQSMTEELLIRLRKIAGTEYEIFPLLKQRYSPRIFRKEAIRDSHLHKLFEAARWSASLDNEQPWRFLYAGEGTETYDKIAACLSEEDRKWAVRAPLLMLSVYKEVTGEGKLNSLALHDLGLCIGGMTVQAQYMGIALHCLKLAREEKVADTFGIPPGFRIAAAIAVGYYGGDVDELPEDLRKREMKERSRMPQAEFAFGEQWGSLVSH